MTEQNANPEIKEADSTIDNAVEFIKEHSCAGLYGTAIEIGQYVIDNLFERDPEAARSRNPKKSASFRKLCKRDDLPIPETTLRRMVHIYLQKLFLDANGIDTTENSPFTYSHLSELVVMKETDATNKEKKLAIVREALKVLENGTLTALKLRKMVSNKLKEGKGQPDTGQAVIYIPTATHSKS